MAETRSVDIYDIADRLWETADELRANSDLKAAEYSIPVLGLIFLRFADSRFTRGGGRAGGQEHRPPRDRQGRLPGRGRPVPARAGALREPPAAAGGRRTSARRINDAMAAIEEENPDLQGRPAADLPGAHERHARRAAPARERHPRRHRGRRLRQGLRVLPRQVRHGRGPEGRRVLHADLHRPADRRDHRAVPRPDPRPGLRLGRHVRSVRPLRRRAPQGKPGRAVDLRPGADRGDRAPLPR